MEHTTQSSTPERILLSEDALNAIECLQTMDELDDELTLDELHSVLDALAAGKDGIPSEVI